MMDFKALMNTTFYGRMSVWVTGSCSLVLAEAMHMEHITRCNDV